MAIQQQIATVSAIQGTVFALNDEGELRTLQQGDALYEGEVLVPSEGGSAELIMADGSLLAVDETETALTRDLLADQAPAADESALGDSTLAALLAAIESGEDLNEALEATAAGLSGGSTGEGHSFVRLARIEEGITSTEFVSTDAVDGGTVLPDADAVVPATTEETVTASLSASSEASEDGGQITYTVTLSSPDFVPPAADMVFELTNGETVTIAAGETSGSTTVTINADDVYLDASPLTNSISGLISGGGEYESLTLDTQTSVSTMITDDTDIVTATLSGSSEASEDGGQVTYTVTLSGAPGDLAPTSDLVFELANGETVTIAKGDTSGSTTVTINEDDVYLDEGTLTNSISSLTSGGGEYESLAFDAEASVSTTIADDTDVVTATLSATAEASEDGGQVTYTVALSGGPGDLAPTSDLVFELANGETITIESGDTSGFTTVTVNEDDVYLDEGTLTNSISSLTSGGGEYESLAFDTEASVSTTIADDTDVVTATLSATAEASEDGGQVTYTVTLSGGPGDLSPTSDLVFELTNGETVTIESGDTSGFTTVTVNRDDVYKEVDSLTNSISSLTSGGTEYESLVFDAEATVSTTITDDKDEVTVTLDDATGVEDGTVTYTATVDHAPQGSFSVTLSNGVVISFADGEKTGSSGPVAAIDGTYTLHIVNSSGGNYEALDLTDTLEVFTPDSEPTVIAENASVDETGGLSADTQSLTVSFGNDIGTVALAADGASWNADNNTLTGKDEDWTIVINGDGTYTVTQLQVMSHNPDGADPNDAITVTVTATATDNENDSTNTDFTVSFLDDGPSIDMPNHAVLSNGIGNSLTDSLVLSSGMDGASVALSGSNDGQYWLLDDDEEARMTSDGHDLLYRENLDGTLLEGYYLDADNAEQSVFNVSYNDDDGTYRVEQTGKIDGGSVFTDIGFSSGYGGGNSGEPATFASGNVGEADSIIVVATADDSDDTVNFNNNALGVSEGSKINNEGVDGSEVLILTLYDGEGFSEVGTGNNVTLKNEDGKTVLDGGGVSVTTTIVSLSYWNLDADETPVVEFYNGGALVGTSVDFPPVIGPDGAYTYDTQGLVFDSLQVSALDESGNGFGVSSATFMELDDGIDQSLTLTATVTDGDNDAVSSSWNLTFDGYRADGVDGSDSDDTLVGNGFNDRIIGGEGDDNLTGGLGYDSLTGGLGVDTFIWQFGDQGGEGSPTIDTVTDFNTGGADILDLRDLLQGESDATLTSYLNFELDSGDTVIHVSSDGGFAGGYDSAAEDQTIILAGVDIVTGATDQTAIINNLSSQLLTDS